MAKKAASPTQPKQTAHYFIDGFSPRNELLGVLGFPIALKGQNVEYAAFFTINNGQWKHQKFDFDGRSVAYVLDGQYRAWWLLGKRGELVEISANGPREEKIADAGTGGKRLGYVNKLARIAGELYVCGYRRQAYRHTNGQWVHIDQGLLAGQDVTDVSLESMDGTSANDIYAVGNEGEIWHFDGRAWQRIDSPTSVHLNEVHCGPDEVIYACGHGGLVVRGRGSRWDVLHNADLTDDFWGIASFRGQVYVAGYGGIARIDGNDLIPVDTGLGRTIRGYRLRTAPDVLWSIGNDDILRFDGTRWEEGVCPYN
jgi:hypothetical protein